MRSTRTLTRHGPAVLVSVVATVAATLSAQPAAHATAGATTAPAEQQVGPQQSGQGLSAGLTLDGVAPGPKTVTLVTGDKVTLTDLGGGHYDIHPTAAPRPDGSIPTFVGRAGPDGFYLYPSDALPLVNSGQLDRELFDVKYLAENGYTDAKTSNVPVIVQYPSTRPAAAAAKAADALPASRPTVALGSIHASALAVAKAHARDFWAAVRGPRPPRPGARTNPLGGGVAKVWLDRKVKPTLDQSVPLIGAPQAWAVGYDGTGVKVAILDTGIDETHPDLAGKIDQARSFVDGVTSPHDGHGHGTHVASIITGSGAASGGKYKGVAPGVTLEIGKVLDDSGSGSDSWVLAGMQWAVTTGAKVVSMSLGAGPTDGTDPLSQAVDDLTAQTGVLFVIAAGNSGQFGSGTVSTPGTADAALTVAATDKADQLASFSSRGPRLDSALKPDIAAPGVNIVAARAAGTNLGTPVGDFYTTLSGTSMATPHVSGAAAILAQEHPDWKAAQLKAALMSTSKDDGYTVYEQGAGRLDVARAVSQKVYATTANLDYGSVPADATPLTKQLTYTNLGDTPVTLTLTPTLKNVDGTAAPDGALTATDTTLTVPAHGTATTTVTLDPHNLAAEATYTGAVVATDQTTGTQLRTPVGAVREPPKVNLTIHTVDPYGTQRFSFALPSILDVGRNKALPSNLTFEVIAPGVLRYRVPHGTYSISNWFEWHDDFRVNVGYLTDPEVTVDGDTDVTLDARQARLIDFTTPLPSDISPRSFNTMMLAQRETTSGTPFDDIVFGATFVRLYVTPTEPVTKGSFLFTAGDMYAAPEVAMIAEGAGGPVLHPLVWPHDANNAQNGGSRVTQAPFPAGTHVLPLVDVGTGSPEELAGLDLHGKLALLADAHATLGDCGVLRMDRLHNIRDAGAAAILAWPTGEPNSCAGGPIAPERVRPTAEDQSTDIGIPYATVVPAEAHALQALLATRTVQVKVTGAPDSPYTYSLVAREHGRIPDNPHYTLSKTQVARVDADYHAARPTAATAGTVSFTPRQLLVTDVGGLAFTAPASRVEYYGPLYPDLVHHRYAFVGDENLTPDSVRVFGRPTRTHDVVNAGPVTPGGARPVEASAYGALDPDLPRLDQNGFVMCSFCRQNNTLFANFNQVQGFEHHDGIGDFAPTLTHLYRDGQEIPITDVGGLPAFRLPPDLGAYRLTLDDPPAGTHSEWTFHSATATDNTTLPGVWCAADILQVAAPCEPAPLVYVSYDMSRSLSMDNTFPAGHAQVFTVDAYHTPTRNAAEPAITDLKLWTSTDDGKHWKPATVWRDHGGTFRAVAIYPDYAHTTGAVSLKVTARDADGNSVTQTSLRAVTLRDVTPTNAQ